ncbi:MAG TPA: YdbH domain-containing protein [Verrucomicrobiae bacterium]|nr:YdbH domain-containing protein [Verrucomicrobiae bacterium]
MRSHVIRRSLKGLGIGLLGLVLLLAAGVAIVWLLRTELLGQTAVRLLERQGLGPASFVVDAVDFGGLHAHDVSLAGGAIKADTLTLAFSPRELLVGHLVKIEIGGLKAALTLGKDGIELGGRPIATSSPGGGPSRLQTLSIDALDLKDAEISLVTPSGTYAGTLSATIALAGGNLKATAVDATLTAPVAGMKGPVKLAFTGDLEIKNGNMAATGINGTLLAPVAGMSGPVSLSFSGALAMTNGDIEATGIAATVSAPVTGLGKPASLTIKKLTFQPAAPGGPRLALEDVAVTPKDLPWTVQGLAGEVLFQSDKSTAKFSVARLTNLQKPAMTQPLKLSGTAALAGSHLDFTLAGETLTKTPAKLQAKGKHELGNGSGSAAVAVAPLAFKRGGLQPGDLFPILAGQVKNLDGTVAIAGTLRWTAKALTPDLTLTLKDVSLPTSSAQIQSINGAIKLSGFWPPATPGGQSLTATITAPGLPPAKLSLTGQLAAKPAVKLDRIAVDIAGGEISATSFTLDPASPNIATILKVDHVDLGEITKLIGLSGLNGSGQLDGQVPFTYKAGEVTIKGGKLTARGPGTLSYKPEKLPDQIAQAGESVQLAMQALSDFHYDKLSLELDKSETGEGTVMLHLEGSNPAVLQGQVFNFNIRIDSNFDRLADIALLSLKSAEELLRRAATGTNP